MFSQKRVEEIVDLLSTLDTSTKIYFGCDSVRSRKNGRWYATYATVFIVHINGKNGCKLFSHMSTEPDYDAKISRPKMRMMKEVQKVCELYTQMIPFIDEFDIEIHLDISQDPKQGSNCAAQEAAGYVLGVTGLPDNQVKLKPDSFAASFGADRVANGKMETSVLMST
jgi:predicted RNase H-related nuclease YkuK (DUF458 family)